jgi:hypothetical protein
LIGPTARDPGEDRPALCIQFEPHPGLLTTTREFVSSFCSTFVTDPDIISRLAIVAHELLENSIKYSKDGKTSMRIDLRTDDAGRRVSIRAENRATPERVIAVCQAIEDLRGAADPLELYCQWIRASVERDTHSGLGLARIRVEADCQLDYAVTGDQVAVLAEATIELETCR